MAGIIAVYSLVIAVLIAGDVKPPPKTYSLFEYGAVWQHSLEISVLTESGSGFMHLGAGLSVGLTGLGAGYTIGIVGDAVRVTYPYRLNQWKHCSFVAGRTSLHAAIANICRHGFNFDLWGSARALWVSASSPIAEDCS